MAEGEVKEEKTEEPKVEVKEEAKSETPVSVAPAAPVATRGGRKIIGWIIGLIIVAVVVWFVWSLLK